MGLGLLVTGAGTADLTDAGTADLTDAGTAALTIYILRLFWKHDRFNKPDQRVDGQHHGFSPANFAPAQRGCVSRARLRAAGG